MSNEDLSSAAYPCLSCYEERLLERGYTLHDITLLRQEELELDNA